MDYRELTEQQYYDRLRVVVAGAEGCLPGPRTSTMGWRPSDMAIPSTGTTTQSAGINLTDAQLREQQELLARGPDDALRRGPVVG